MANANITLISCAKFGMTPIRIMINFKVMAAILDKKDHYFKIRLRRKVYMIHGCNRIYQNKAFIIK